MIEISEPLKPGDLITFKNSDGEIVSEGIVEGFWEDRPKGGKEFCYRTVMGNIVPLSHVMTTEVDKKNGPHAFTVYSDNFHEEDKHYLVSTVVEASNLSSQTKAVIHLLLQDDIESLGLAKELLEVKLKSLRKVLSQETKEKT